MVNKCFVLLFCSKNPVWNIIWGDPCNQAQPSKMAAPPHYVPGLPGQDPQQYQGQRNPNPSSDEVVIYFQNYHNRPSMGVPTQPPLPPPPHQAGGGKGACNRSINPFPLNFTLPPRPATTMNEHEAAAYFLAHMSNETAGGHSHTTEAGPQHRDMNLHRDMSNEASALRDLRNETVAHRNSSASENNQNVPATSRESAQIQDRPVNSRDPVQNQNRPLDSGNSAQNQNPPISSENSVQNQNRPLTSGESAQSRNHPSSSRDAVSVSNRQDTTSPLTDQEIDRQDHGPTSGNRINSSDDEDDEEQQALIPAQLSTSNVEMILSKPRRRMTPEEKVIFNRLKHPLKPPCKCARKCSEKINEERRKTINYSFWGLTYVERAMFLMGHVKRTRTNRKTVRGLSRRRFSLTYNMLDEKDRLVTVCKIFFVATLGLVSDKCITQLFIKNPVGTLIPEDDMRGKHKPANKIDTTLVKMHIEAYCKQFPVPNKNKRLHIPPGITKMQMYNDFKARVKDYKCGPSRYAQVVKEMNVVFGRKKAPKQPKTATPTAAPQPSHPGHVSNDGQQNQNNPGNNPYNRIGNFSIPGSQGDNQSMMYPGQASGTIPQHPQMALWDQIDQHMFQSQFMDSGPSGPSSGSNSNKDNEASTSQNFTVTAPPPGLMPLPGFVVPENTSGGCENCLACRIERENAAIAAAEAAETATDDDEDTHTSESQQQNVQAPTQPRPRPIPTIPVERPKVIPKRPRNDEERAAHKRMKYPLLPPCSCPKKCREKINEERRKLINYLFWGLQYQMRAMFLLNHIKQCEAKRHTLSPGEPSRRKFSRSYTLPDENDKQQSVCKIFFLHTLGYTSDSVVTKLLRKNPMGTVVPVSDRRGRNTPRRTLDLTPVKEHIQQHMKKSKGKYRLPADVNIRRMWKDFRLRNPDVKCGYESYRQVIKDIRGGKKSQQQQPTPHPASHPSAAAALASTTHSAAIAAQHSAVVMDMLKLIDP